MPIVRCSWRSEAVSFPGAGVISDCEVHDVVGAGDGTLKEQQALLTSHPSLQLPGKVRFFSHVYLLFPKIRL